MVGDEGFGVVNRRQKRACSIPVEETKERSDTSDLVIISVKTIIERIVFLYMVGDEGFEPPTSSLSVTRSNQLS